MDVLKQFSSVELLDRLLGAEDPLVQALVEKELRARLSTEAPKRSNGALTLGKTTPPDKSKPWELISLATWRLGSRKPYKPSAKSAHRLIHRLVQKGWLAKPDKFECQACHQAPASCYSVKDRTYTNPLAVFPTCRPCSLDATVRERLAKKCEAAVVTKDTTAADSNGLNFHAGHLYSNLEGGAKGYGGPEAHSDFVPPDDDVVTYGLDVDVLKTIQEISRMKQLRNGSYCVSFQKGLHQWFGIEPY